MKLFHQIQIRDRLFIPIFGQLCWKSVLECLLSPIPGATIACICATIIVTDGLFLCFDSVEVSGGIVVVLRSIIANILTWCYSLRKGVNRTMATIYKTRENFRFCLWLFWAGKSTFFKDSLNIDSQRIYQITLVTLRYYENAKIQMAFLLPFIWNLDKRKRIIVIHLFLYSMLISFLLINFTTLSQNFAKPELETSR